jgi:hypothetical protein
MNLGRWLVVGVTCLAGPARADRVDDADGSLEARLGVGARTSSTTESMYDMVYDDTSSVRLGADALVGIRYDRFVIGLHGGISTPLKFSASPLADSGETVAHTDSTIYPLDLGLGVQVDLAPGVWASAWFGATLAFSSATSPAQHINAIDYTGDIPAASWSYSSTSLAFGASVGYDFVRSSSGRFGAAIAVESQGVGTIAERTNMGGTGSEPQALRSTAFTFGVAYSY